MGGRQVCCITLVFTVDIREKRTRRFLYLLSQGLYGFCVNVKEEMT